MAEAEATSTRTESEMTSTTPPQKEDSKSTVSKSSYRTVRNRCSKVRVQLGEKTLRCVSFFADHPSMCPEDQWHPKHIGEDFVLIDTFTLQLMSECESQFLVESATAGEAEPTIVAVEMRPRRDGGRPKTYGKSIEKGDITEEMGKLTVNESEGSDDGAKKMPDPEQVKDTI